MSDYLVWRLADGRLWDTRAARWLDQAAPASGDGAPGAVIVDLISSEGRSDEAYLAKALAHGGWPLGELAPRTEAGIKGELRALDAAYLTPRPLAGLSAGDSEALARWREHERLAAPLREKLTDLEAEAWDL